MAQYLKFKLFQIITFGLILVISIILVSAQSKIKSRCKQDKSNVGSGLDIASDDSPASSENDGSSRTIINSNEIDTGEKPKVYPEGFRPLQIISKPRATHTEESRKNCIEGKVLLRITFFADGTVGNFRVIKGLPAGLNKRAIEAAKKLKFEPELRNNKPVSVTKKVEYGFWLY